MSSGAIIFAGPSLAGCDLDRFRSLEFRDPCGQGDLFLAAQSEPQVIGIIDGYFEGVPSVWHKEVLWAMANGIHVIGASSMGALRAAELDVFGMQGIGTVYDWYADGSLEDDDEVALVHGPEEMGYIALSEPMVNIRATVNEAVNAGAVSESNASRIIDTAKAQFYKNRTWETVFVACKADHPELEEISAFENWLTENRIDQKQMDAIELCDFVATNDFSEPMGVDFEFEVTNFWVQNTKTWLKRARKPDKQESSEGFRLFS